MTKICMRGVESFFECRVACCFSILGILTLLQITRKLQYLCGCASGSLDILSVNYRWNHVDVCWAAGPAG